MTDLRQASDAARAIAAAESSSHDVVNGASVSAASPSRCDRSSNDGLTVPGHFDVPDPALWERGYAAEARCSLLDTARTLIGALAVVRPFIDPILDGTAAGSWERARRWIRF